MTPMAAMATIAARSSSRSRVECLEDREKAIKSCVFTTVQHFTAGAYAHDVSYRASFAHHKSLQIKLSMQLTMLLILS